MMMDADNVGLSAAEELNNICISDDLSLLALQEKINQLSLPVQMNVLEKYGNNPFLHQACMNDNVTLDIIKLIVEKFPWSIDFKASICRISNSTTSSVLHCACHNDNCPDEVIEFILNSCSRNITEYSCFLDEGVEYGGIESDEVDEFIKGLPLHYYLARKTHVGIDIVKKLVQAYPKALLNNDNKMKLTPLHVLIHNDNIDNLQEILTYLIEQEPSTLRLVDGYDRTPLHVVCRCINKKVNLAVVQYIYYQWPEAARLGDWDDKLPYYMLCDDEELVNSYALDILRFMISVDPNLLREEDEDECLPIHNAVTDKSTFFCKELIDAYPESLRIGSIYNLPIHIASTSGRIDAADTIQYMLDIDPDSNNIYNGGGYYPIHVAAVHGRAHIVEMLLEYDINVASKKTVDDERRLPLHVACAANTKTKGHLKTVQILYDAYPEGDSIEDNTPHDYGNGHTPFGLASEDLSYDEYKKSKIVKFFLKEAEYAGIASDTFVTEYPGERPSRMRKSEDVEAMTTLDENGWMPLQHALKDRASLGSIKLLAGGNPPSVVRTTDYNMAFPLHIACEFSSVKVVKYLADFDVGGHIMSHVDVNMDSILHYACRGGNLEVVQYLLAGHASLAKVNANGLLPLHLLCAAGKGNRKVCENPVYVETIWSMLLADPESLMS